MPGYGGRELQVARENPEDQAAEGLAGMQREDMVMYSDVYTLPWL